MRISDWSSDVCSSDHFMARSTRWDRGSPTSAGAWSAPARGSAARKRRWGGRRDRARWGSGWRWTGWRGFMGRGEGAGRKGPVADKPPINPVRVERSRDTVRARASDGCLDFARHERKLGNGLNLPLNRPNSPLRPRPYPASRHGRRDHRQHHPRPGRNDRGKRDAERKRRRRCDLALAADRALLAPRGDMMPEMAMRQQPDLEPRRRARAAEGGKDDERHRRQQRQERADRAESQRSPASDQIEMPFRPEETRLNSSH